MAQDSPAPDDIVSFLRSGQAPLQIRQFAARGLLPLDRNDQTRALLVVSGDEDPETAESARAALREIGPDELSRFLLDGSPTAEELDAIAHYTDDPFVLEQVIRHKEVSDTTLDRLARTVSGAPQEALIINQVRLIRTPSLIDALFENPELTADGRRRLLEVREEFFEKDARRREGAAAAEEDTLDPEIADEVAASVAAAEAEEARIASRRGKPSPDLDKSLTTGAAYKRISMMTVSQKIKLAYSGGKEERRILMGDANKLIGAAVLKSRGLTVNEVEAFCSMRHLDEDIFRKIADSREWMRRPAIVIALVKNPKVNISVTLPLIKRLNERDLKTIMRDTNLPEGIRIAARKLFTARRK
ncbi:MAG TPA: hypothetical protein VE007_03085 [Thermoanaerobaculia bacterium]|nr:hypothetical protein [Thermoanaerobaculia bacterium]